MLSHSPFQNVKILAWFSNQSIKIHQDSHKQTNKQLTNFGGQTAMYYGQRESKSEKESWEPAKILHSGIAYVINSKWRLSRRRRYEAKQHSTKEPWLTTNAVHYLVEGPQTRALRRKALMFRFLARFVENRLQRLTISWKSAEQLICLCSQAPVNPSRPWMN